ncbi:MAG: HAD-IIB family hydrolase [Verrucomicrobiota bacterium]
MHLLLSTDFDGTLVTHPEKNPFAPDFIKQLTRLRESHKVTWVINTGRSWHILEHSLGRIPPAIPPDWVVVLEREAYEIKGKESIPLNPWNQNCRRIHSQLFEESNSTFNAIRKACAHFSNIQLVEDEGCPLGIIAADDQQANEVDAIVKEHIKHLENLSIMRNTIYFRFCHIEYHKGSALNAIAKKLDIPVSQRFVVGDQLNDLQMLDRKVAKHIACPSNASDAVKNRVLEQGGYIANQPDQRGIAEALQKFF